MLGAGSEILIQRRDGLLIGFRGGFLALDAGELLYAVRCRTLNPHILRDDIEQFAIAPQDRCGLITRVLFCGVGNSLVPRLLILILALRAQYLNGSGVRPYCAVQLPAALRRILVGPDRVAELPGLALIDGNHFTLYRHTELRVCRSEANAVPFGCGFGRCHRLYFSFSGYGRCRFILFGEAPFLQYSRLDQCGTASLSQLTLVLARSVRKSVVNKRFDLSVC